MGKKLHKHNVTFSDRKRDKKKTTDMMGKDISKEPLSFVFNTVYKDQVRALYREITKRK